MGCRQDQVGGRFLHRGRRHHRLPERPRHRRRLHVGSVVPRHLGRGDGHRLRWPDLLHRLPGRLADHHLPDGGTPAQPRQVHLCRRGRLSLRANPHPGVRGIGHAGRGGVLPDRPDGGRGRADQIAVRPRLLDCSGAGGGADDGVRALRWHDGHDLGTDHQGLHAAGGRDVHGDHGAGAIWLQSRGAVCQGRGGAHADRGQWRQDAP